MRNIFIILLVLLSQTSIAQYRHKSFAEIDERAKSIDPAPPAELASLLTKDYHTDNEKLRSIFTWITDHISYRVKNDFQRIQVNTRRSRFTDTSKWISANDFMASTVLQNQSAVCDGYARLFKTLCDYGGLRSAVITGFAKGDYNRRFIFRCNHSWNAVYLDSAWHLLDLTWASGYTNYRGDEFTKRLDETYYLSAPEDFIRDHFPDDLRWTLMENPPFPEELKSDAYRNKCFAKYKISGFFPTNGILEAAIGDTIRISLETMDTLQDGKISADTVQVFDDALEKLNASVAFLEPSFKQNKKQNPHYEFIVLNNDISWLHIEYNHDTVLRYRLKIKKRNLPTAGGYDNAVTANKP